MKKTPQTDALTEKNDEVLVIKNSDALQQRLLATNGEIEDKFEYKLDGLDKIEMLNTKIASLGDNNGMRMIDLFFISSVIEKETRNEGNPVLEVTHYKKVDEIWVKKNENEIVAHHDHIKEILSVRNLKTLKPGTWLNDEV
mgnify:FL=1